MVLIPYFVCSRFACRTSKNLKILFSLHGTMKTSKMMWHNPFGHRSTRSDTTYLGYGFSSSNIASTSTTVFVPPSNNVEIENHDVKTDLASDNLDKRKSILGAPLKQDKKEAKNPRVKKANSQKSKQKKQHLCHHCGVTGHTWPNCYKWLATQQSNGMIALGTRINFNPLLLLLEIFSKPSCSFQT